MVPSFTTTKSHVCHRDQEGHGPEQRHQGVENTYLKEDIRRGEKVAFIDQSNKLYVKDNMNLGGSTPIAKLSKYKPLQQPSHLVIDGDKPPGPPDDHHP